MIGVIILFRLILFKKLSDIKNCCSKLEDLYLERLKDNKIFIQDTDEMVIESYTLDELRDIEKKYNISFDGFGFDLITKQPKIYGSQITISSCRCLSNSLTIRYSNRRKSTNLINSYPDETHSLVIKYLRKSMEFSSSIYWVNSDGFQVLSFNDKPFLVLNSKKFYMDVYFDLVQVCKTEIGFELVILFQAIRMYLGIGLDNNLNLVGFENLDYIRGSCLALDSNFKDVRLFIAKHKLLNDWSDINV